MKRSLTAALLLVPVSTAALLIDASREEEPESAVCITCWRG